MTTILDLTPSYLFAKKLNIVILCVVFALVAVSIKLPLSVLASSSYVVVFLCLVAIVCWPQSVPIQYFSLREGEAGKSFGFNSKPNNETNFVLCESKCRVSILGCWLVFAPDDKDSKHAFIGRFLFSHTSVFVPKHYIEKNEYKRLCRQLIWHSR